MTPQITPAKVAEILTQHNVVSANYPGGLILAIRGYYRDILGDKGQNDTGMYDDAFIFVVGNQIFPLRGNTDPSRVGWNSAIGKPFAMLCPGLWFFIRGEHKGFRPALRQPDETQARDFRIPNRGHFRVYRAKSESELVQHSAPTEEGYFAINFHPGGEEITPDKAATHSWGCLTAEKELFVPWMSRVWETSRKACQDVIPLLLIENTVGDAKQVQQ